MKRTLGGYYVGFMLLLLTILVTVIGMITYRNLTSIISDLQTDNKPGDKLLVLKEIMLKTVSLEDYIENYRLSGAEEYLIQYDDDYFDITVLIDSIKRESGRDRELTIIADSLQLLFQEKNSLLERILTIDNDDQEYQYRRLEAQIRDLPEVTFKDSVVSDTIRLDTVTIIKKEPPKQGFLRKIFGRKNESNQDSTVLQVISIPVPVSVPVNKDSILAAQTKAYSDQISAQLEEFKAESKRAEVLLNKQELELQNRHNLIQDRIIELIDYMESRETLKQKIATLKARELADRTNHQVLTFSSLTLILLVVTIIALISYMRKTAAYQRLLTKSKNETENLSSMKERFFANISHEIRTPMNAISGFAQLLLSSKLTAKQREQVEIIDQSSDHLLRLLNDMLDFSKLRAQKLKLEKKVFDPQKVFEECTQLMKGLAEKKGLMIEEKYEELPNHLHGDPYRLKQIVLNILNNAVKYTDKGHVKIEVSSTVKSTKSLLSIKIKDTGKGIDKEHQKRLFREFEQADQSSFSKGTGLGLAITRQMVSLHRGIIKLVSEPGKGTMVMIQIPYQLAKESEKQADIQKEAPSIDGLRVIVADDEPFNVKLLSNILDNEGATYDTAEDGEQALELLNKNQYDVALLDLRMPKLTGWEVVAAVKSSKEHINYETLFIALTATVTQIDEPKRRESGFDKILRKPFNQRNLIELIAQKGERGNKEITQSIEDKVVDLTSLNKMGDENFVSDMVETFIQSAQSGWKDILDYYKTKQYESLSLTAHRIVAPARHFKALALVDKLKQLEQMSLEAPGDIDNTLLQSTEKELNKVVEALKQNHKVSID